MGAPSITMPLVAALVVAGIAAAPSSQQPAPATAARAVAGDFVWHDLVTGNPAAARAFYGALLGWTFEDGEGIDPGYTVIRQGDLPIGGIVLAREAAAASAEWLSYVVVADVDRAVSATTAAGGRVHRGPLNARKDLRVAAVADPQGAAVGFASRGPYAATDRAVPGDINRWLWMEYVARDVAPALEFYGKIVGYGNRIGDPLPKRTYHLLTTDLPRAGVFASPWPRETSAWLPYVRVADPAALAKRAVELGGSVLLAPRADIRAGSLAIVIDPGGAAVALQKYPFEQGGTP
jgi:predicted enzyme related to lactoylglutathione lyase